MFKNKNFLRLIKFAGCSTAAWLADFAVFTVAYDVLGVHYIAAKACSYTIGAFTSYTLNRKLTFRSQKKFVSATLFKFIAVNCVSVSLSLGSMYVFSDVLGISVWISYFLSVIFSFSANYTGNRFWVFKGISGDECRK